MDCKNISLSTRAEAYIEYIVSKKLLKAFLSKNKEIQSESLVIKDLAA